MLAAIEGNGTYGIDLKPGICLIQVEWGYLQGLPHDIRMEGELGGQTLHVGNVIWEGSGEFAWEMSRDGRGHPLFIARAGRVVADTFVLHRVVAGDCNVVILRRAITRAGVRDSGGGDGMTGRWCSGLGHGEIGRMLTLRVESRRMKNEERQRHPENVSNIT